MQSVTTNGNKHLLLGAERSLDKVCRGTSFSHGEAHYGELLVLCNRNCNRMVCESLATLVRNGIQQLGGREWERRKGNLLV